MSYFERITGLGQAIDNFFERQRQASEEYRRLTASPHLFLVQYVPPDAEYLSVVRALKSHAVRTKNGGYELQPEEGSVTLFHVNSVVSSALAQEESRKKYSVKRYDPLQIRATEYRRKGTQIEHPQPYAVMRIWRDLTKDESEQYSYGATEFEGGWSYRSGELCKFAKLSNSTLNGLGINIQIAQESEFLQPGIEPAYVTNPLSER